MDLVSSPNRKVSLLVPSPDRKISLMDLSPDQKVSLMDPSPERNSSLLSPAMSSAWLKKSNRSYKKTIRKKKLLKKLIARNTNEVIDNMTPQVASHVAKNYFLPMFEADDRKQADIERAQQFGIDDSKCKADMEMLSEKLSRQLAERKEQQAEINMNLENTQKETTVIQQDLDQLRLNYLQVMTKIQEMQLLLSMDTKQDESRALNWKPALSRDNEFQQKLNEKIKSKDEIGKNFWYRKLKNEIQARNVLRLESDKETLRMQSTISGELLKGLYTGMETVLDTKAFSEPVKWELVKCSAVARKISQQESGQGVSTGKMQLDNTRDLGLMHVYSQQYQQYKNDTLATRIRMRETYERVTEENEQSAFSVEQLTADLATKQTRVASIHENIERLRHIIQQNQGNTREAKQEQTCKNCNKYYYDKDNYNWSCTTHSSVWNGIMWWCCGKTEENALGCIVKSHEPREENEHQDSFAQREKEIQEKKKLLTYKCRFCNEVGHLPQNCHKDPNIRTMFPMQDELKRISNIQKGKNEKPNY